MTGAFILTDLLFIVAALQATLALYRDPARAAPGRRHGSSGPADSM